MLLDGGRAQIPRPGDEPQRQRRITRNILILTIGVPLIAAVILYITYPSIFSKHFPGIRTSIVRSNSMAPTVLDGDMAWINYLTYDRNEPKIGDVVMYTTTLNGKPFNGLKRIIAATGDEIKIEDGQIFVNGQICSGPHVDEPPNWMPEYGPVKIPAGKYFVLGDNRNHSYDSRAHGPIDRAQILGKMTSVSRMAKPSNKPEPAH